VLRLLLLVLSAASIHAAGVIRGMVVENQSGKPLSRATVVLQPIDGTPGSPRPVRTSTYGSFEFASLADGAYIVKASRRGFLPTEYGQKQWNSAGVPVFLKDNASTFLTIRLPRYGAITGTVVDENDVGVPEFDVLAYRRTDPPQLVTRARSDERGIYRLTGLEPGYYLVRTAANQDDGLDYLPTFSRETQTVAEAHTAQVFLDEDTRNMDVRPAPGKLFSVSGTVVTEPPGIAVTVILSSDIGRQVTQGPGFQFDGLPPGPYEIYAEAPENRALNAKYQAAHLMLSVYRDVSKVSMSTSPPRETRFDFNPAPAGGSSSQVLARRKDLAGLGPTMTLQMTNNRAPLSPGRWELSVVPPPGYYVSGFTTPSMPPAGRGRPDGWNEVLISGFGGGVASIALSSNPGSVRGVVKAAAGELAPGAPVYLEAYDAATQKRLTDLRATRTDLQGAYRFDGLAPGNYRILSTFEYQMPDAAAMDLAGARSVSVEAGGVRQMDLDLYELR
jgi:protocatechuate 3,4-dioxygenase beta subunit